MLFYNIFFCANDKKNASTHQIVCKNIWFPSFDLNSRGSFSLEKFFTFFTPYYIKIILYICTTVLLFYSFIQPVA